MVGGFFCADEAVVRGKILSAILESLYSAAYEVNIALVPSFAIVIRLGVPF